jgi:DNA primase
MARYSDEILGRIRDSVDIVEWVSQVVPLKKAGANYKGLCPFHEEKTPSFNVHPGKRIFYCFGCSRGGDIFKFTMLHRNLTFPEAIRILADKAGVSLPASAPETPPDEGEERMKRGIRKINETAARFYRDGLSSKAGAGARKYLAERGISDASIETFGIGLAPAGWQNLLEHLGRNGFSSRQAVAAGLAKPRSGGDGAYDVFRGRIVFPIRTPGGGIAGFGGRTFGGEEEDAAPKYLNSPDTPVFRKNRTLYGLHESKETIRGDRTALIVEGYFDVIALHQHGFKNVVASMGTALTSDHVGILRREGFCETLVFCFDPDAAGEGAARRGGAMLLEKYQQAGLPEKWRGGKELTTLLEMGGPGGGAWNRMALRVVVLPSGFDADSYVRSRGAESFGGLLEKAKNLIDYLLDRTVSAHPADSPIERRLEALQEAASLLSGQREAVRREYVRDLSERLRIDGDLAERVLRSRGRRDEGVQATVEVKAKSERLPPAEKMLVQVLLSHPELAVRLDLPMESFSDPRLRRIGSAAVASAGEAETGGLGEGEFVPAVLAAVGDPDVEKLAAALAMTPPVWADEPERAAGECIARILSDGLKRRKEDWRSRIDDAKRRGDEDAVQSLMEEREAMRREQVAPLQEVTQAE